MRLGSLSFWTLLGVVFAPPVAFGQDPAPAEPPPVVAAPSGARQVQMSSQQQPEEGPARTRRRGWTLEAGLGVGYINVPDAHLGRGGLYGLNVGAGRFLTSDIAITLRGTGVYTLDSTGSMIMASGIVSVQSFVTDRITIAGGFGVAFADISVGAMRVSRYPGFAGNVRVGFGLAEWPSGTLRAVFEMNAGKIATTRLISDGLGLEWQFY